MPNEDYDRGLALGYLGIGTTKPEGFIHIASSGGETIVTITHDGVVVVNPKYTTDEAALAFWQAVTQLSRRTIMPDIKLDKLRVLKDDWDNDGALAPTADAIDVAERLLNMLREVPGQAVPMTDGGVQIEWHASGFDVEFVITPEGTMELE
jgi:hypothetical protein